MRPVLVLAIWMTVAALATDTAAAAKPRRIVSLNLCGDQLVVALAERTAIASVTYLAADPIYSPVAERAEGLPVNHGRAEEVLAQHPDLVVASRFALGGTVALLKRLGVPILELDVVADLDAVRDQIRRVADRLGETARGDALVAEMDATIATQMPPPGAVRPVAAIYREQGGTAGRGSLADAVLAAAGFDNLAARRGIVGAGTLPLESLIVADPDAIVFSALAGEAPSLARAVLDHRALRAALADDRARAPAVADIPARLWSCGGPAVAEAVARLARLRSRLAPR